MDADPFVLFGIDDPLTQQEWSGAPLRWEWTRALKPPGSLGSGEFEGLMADVYVKNNDW